jgi:protoheme IX farnesyltransferase
MKTYYMLTKPGIIMGNLITTAGGFALASKAGLNFLLFIQMLIGLGLVIASACICNNYIDRIADQKMARTKNRGFAKGSVSIIKALSLALGLGLSGVFILAYFTNLLTVCVAISGFFIYVVVYSYVKYYSHFSTLMGSIAGAVPPVVGYTAVSNKLDLGAVLLFAILVLWQMPHFYSIALYRFDEYKAASIPVLPVTKGVYLTKVQMVIYIIAFMGATSLLTILGYTGYAYLVLATLLGGTWLVFSFKGFKAQDDKKWARKMFAISLVTIVSISASLFG